DHAVRRLVRRLSLLPPFHLVRCGLAEDNGVRLVPTLRAGLKQSTTHCPHCRPQKIARLLDILCFDHTYTLVLDRATHISDNLCNKHCHRSASLSLDYCVTEASAWQRTRCRSTKLRSYEFPVTELSRSGTGAFSSTGSACSPSW